MKIYPKKKKAKQTRQEVEVVQQKQHDHQKPKKETEHCENKINLRVFFGWIFSFFSHLFNK